MKGRIIIVLLVLIFLALVGNLAYSAVQGESPVTETMAKIGAFWALVLANLSLAGTGIYFTTKSHQKFEKSAIEWGRRGFISIVMITLVFSIAPWIFFRVPEEIAREDAMFNVTLVLLLFGITNAMFLGSFYREYLRATGSRSGAARGRRRAPGAKGGPGPA